MKSLNNFLRWFFITSETKYDRRIDSKLLFAAITLILFGIVMVYSASIAYAATSRGINNQYYYLIRYVGYVIVGIIAGVISFNTPTVFWQKHAPRITLIVVIFLVAVLIPHVGKMVNGSKRWIGIGFLSLQPSEFAKLAIAIYIADYTSKHQISGSNSLKNLAVSLAVIMLFVLLLLLEPDMGSAVVVFIVAVSILYLSNLNAKFMLSIIIVGIVGFIALVVLEPYRMRRVLGFIDPWQDALGKGYQLTHSLLAVGHGGWFGVGLGNSIEKLFYLPEAHTDFILAIIAEEFGAVGILVIMTLFWLIFYRGFSVIASDARSLIDRKFQALLAQGISIWFFVQALVNVGVTIGMLPTKGLTLPFISYGGSSILVSCIALSILLRIDYENKQIKYGVW